MLTRSHTQEVWGKVQGDTTSDLIRQVADMLCQGKSKDAIRARCVAEGLTDEQAYLTYMAAVIIAGDRVGARRKVA